MLIGNGTQTAECISEATGRPLLSLTAGDIGTNEARAERTLAKWFRMAEIWGAVMLLDEADVFLEKRVHQDLQRNSLVSSTSIFHSMDTLQVMSQQEPPETARLLGHFSKPSYGYKINC